MKLNPVCIKDILEVFETTVTDAGVTYQYQTWDELQKEHLLQKYSVNEVAYHCQQIYLSGYLYRGKIYSQGGVSFMDITPDAHTLLANLRTPKVLKIIQRLVESTGSASINQIAKIASEASLALLPDMIEAAKNAFQKSP